MSDEVRGRDRGKLLSTKQVAEFLGVKEYTVRRLCVSGQLAHLRVNGAGGKRDTYRISELDLDDYIEQVRVAKAPVPPEPQVEVQPPAAPPRRRRRSAPAGEGT